MLSHNDNDPVHTWGQGCNGLKELDIEIHTGQQTPLHWRAHSCALTGYGWPAGVVLDSMDLYRADYYDTQNGISAAVISSGSGW